MSLFKLLMDEQKNQNKETDKKNLTRKKGLNKSEVK